MFACALTSADEPAPTDPAFFEQRIRPMLVERCGECHGEAKQEGGLRLDTVAGLRRGSDSGPIIAPSDPTKSRLIDVIHYQGDVQMPPDEPLSPEEQHSIETWIASGAWLPEESAPRSADPSRPHWAFQPLSEAPLPEVENAGPQPIDRFVVQRLREAGLEPTPAADRRTLLRRAKFDLLGLPATLEEIERFQADSSPEAWTRVVDELLASPHYGERWARHWLDVARYADTKGYVFTQDGRYPYAYTYRDYVIRALNDDVPFDQFVREQLAADLLPKAEPDNPARLAALGFLTLGRRFSNNTHDIIDDRIDVVTRGLLGLTVTCARCHDHKYDPIPTDDYYSLYGVFASSTEPGDLPLIGAPSANEAYRAFEKELGEKQQALDAFNAQQINELGDEFRRNVTAYLEAAVQAKDDVAANKDTTLSFNAGDIRPEIVRRWRAYLNDPKRAESKVFGLWHVLRGLPAESFASQAGDVLAGQGEHAERIGEANPRLLTALREQPPTNASELAQRYGSLLAAVYAEWQQTQSGAEPPKELPDPASEELRQALFADGTPTVLKAEHLPELLDRPHFEEYGKLVAAVGNLKATSPEAPPRAMALADAPTPHEPMVFIRGNPHRPGKAVPRQFLSVLAGADRKPFTHGSGRLELADAIVDPKNPLTARVIVNRVWMHHFGAGLVRTPSDFGTRSEPPSHPELLDWLAGQFVRDGWSLKKLHRAILLSDTYQQASAPRPEALAVDPENRLLWRMSPRRLEFEALRDSLLSVSGQLDPTLYGRPIEMLRDPQGKRRTIYAYLDRQDLPAVLRVFDFANIDSSTPQRAATTVPQQALYLLNSPLVLTQAEALAARPEVCGVADPSARVQELYARALSRRADDDEVRTALEYVQAQGEGPQGWQRLAQALLASNEFVFVD